MPSRRAALAAALIGALLPVASTAAPAHAERLLLRDGPGDVWSATVTQPPAPSPTVRAGDVLRTRVAHLANKVVIRSVYLDLRFNAEYSLFRADLRTGAGRLYEARIDASRGNPVGVKRLFRAGGEVDCPIWGRIAYARNLVRITVPRRCVGDPRLVRVRVASSWADARGVFHHDNPHNRLAHNGAFTPWLRRG